MAVGTRRTSNTSNRDPPPSRGTKTVVGTSADGGTVTEDLVDQERAPLARAESNPQPSPPRVDNTSVVPQDDEEDAKARGLEALNQMHDEI